MGQALGAGAASLLGVCLSQTASTAPQTGNRTRASQGSSSPGRNRPLGVCSPSTCHNRASHGVSPGSGFHRTGSCNPLRLGSASAAHSSPPREHHSQAPPGAGGEGGEGLRRALSLQGSSCATIPAWPPQTTLLKCYACRAACASPCLGLPWPQHSHAWLGTCWVYLWTKPLPGLSRLAVVTFPCPGPCFCSHTADSWPRSAL